MSICRALVICAFFCLAHPTRGQWELADLQGRWWIQVFEIDPSLNWLRGPADVGQDGRFTNFWTHKEGTMLVSGIHIGTTTGLGAIEYRRTGWDYSLACQTLLRPGMDLAVGTGCTEQSDLLIHYPPPEPTKSFVAAVRMDPAGYVQADLAGTWLIVGLDQLATNSHWVRGWITVSNTGAFTGTVTDSTGASAPMSGTMSLTVEGEVTTSINASWHGALSAKRDVIVACQTRGPNRLEADLLVRHVGPFAVEQLAGRYGSASLISSYPADRSESVVSIATNGAFRICMRPLIGLPKADTGTMRYSADGVITIVDNPGWLAVSNPDRDFLAGNTTEDGTAFFAGVRLSQDMLRITRFMKTTQAGMGDVAVFQWLGAGLERYEIEQCDSLFHTISWSLLAAGLTGEWTPHSTRAFGLQTAIVPWPSVPSRFYRIKIPFP
jgi:hypothetical protein